MMQELNTQIDIINKAWRSKIIYECTNPELAQRLNLVYFLIGLRPHHFPSKEEDIIIFTYLRKKYPNRTIDELYLAFDLAINNKLDIDDCKVYDQFSIEYLVRIMNSYGRYVYRLMKDTIKPAALIENKVTISEQEKLEDINQFFTQRVDDTDIMPMYIYDWLISLTLINYTESRKVKLYSRAIALREHELRVTLIKEPRNQNAKEQLETLRLNNKSGWKNAMERDIASIHSLYKKVVILYEREKFIEVFNSDFNRYITENNTYETIQ